MTVNYRQEDKDRHVIRWRPSRGQVLWAVAIGSLVAAMAVFIFLGYYFRWKWTGFPSQRLFNWMQILVIPVAVAVGTFVLNQAAKKRETAAEKAQREGEEALQQQRAEDAVLQAYIEYMSQLLTGSYELLTSPIRGRKARMVARAQTLTALGRLRDGVRKRSALQFLYEAHLIMKDHTVLDL